MWFDIKIDGHCVNRCEKIKTADDRKIWKNMTRNLLHHKVTHVMMMTKMLIMIIPVFWLNTCLTLPRLLQMGLLTACIVVIAHRSVFSVASSQGFGCSDVANFRVPLFMHLFNKTMKNNVAVEQLGSCSDFHALNSANTTCIGYDTIHSILSSVYVLDSPFWQPLSRSSGLWHLYRLI